MLPYNTKRHEFHIGKVLPNEQFIACEIDRRSIKQGDSSELKSRISGSWII